MTQVHISVIIVESCGILEILVLRKIVILSLSLLNYYMFFDLITIKLINKHDIYSQDRYFNF